MSKYKSLEGGGDRMPPRENPPPPPPPSPRGPAGATVTVSQSVPRVRVARDTDGACGDLPVFDSDTVELILVLDVGTHRREG